VAKQWVVPRQGCRVSDVKTSSLAPSLCKRRIECVRVYNGTATRINEDGTITHPSEFVLDVGFPFAARIENIYVKPSGPPYDAHSDITETDDTECSPVDIQGSVNVRN
jgi:hypothetical protein